MIFVVLRIFYRFIPIQYYIQYIHISQTLTPRAFARNFLHTLDDCQLMYMHCKKKLIYEFQQMLPLHRNIEIQSLLFRFLSPDCKCNPLFLFPNRFFFLLFFVSGETSFHCSNLQHSFNKFTPELKITFILENTHECNLLHSIFGMAHLCLTRSDILQEQSIHSIAFYCFLSNLPEFEIAFNSIRLIDTFLNHLCVRRSQMSFFFDFRINTRIICCSEKLFSIAQTKQIQIFNV